VEHTQLRTAEYGLGAARMIDKEGYLTGDEMDLKRIAEMYKLEPEAVKGFWEKIGGEGDFKFKKRDDKGNFTKLDEEHVLKEGGWKPEEIQKFKAEKFEKEAKTKKAAKEAKKGEPPPEAPPVPPVSPPPGGPSITEVPPPPSKMPEKEFKELKLTEKEEEEIEKTPPPIAAPGEPPAIRYSKIKMESEFSPDIKATLDKSVDMKNNIIAPLSGLTGKPGFLTNPDQFWQMRKLIGSLSEQIKKMSETQMINFREIGQKLFSLDSSLPTNEEIPFSEINKILADRKVTEDDISEIVKKFKT
jgi:hypothetical protein